MTASSPIELAGLKAAGRVVRDCLEAMRRQVAPGVTTLELDQAALRVMELAGARSAPTLVYGFPGATCISLNDEAVHGIPSARRLVEGDLVKLDVTVELGGYFADACVTVPVGEVSKDATRVIRVAEEALAAALEIAHAGTTLRDVGRVIERTVEAGGCRVLRDICGHGIGRSIHEPPNVLNYDAGQRGVLKEGMVLTIEPIISLTTRESFYEGEWVIKSKDGSRSAHAEHSLVITQSVPLLLTA